jgi:hypothetical protein
MLPRPKLLGHCAGDDRVDPISFERTHYDQLLDQCLNSGEMSRGWLLIN